MTDAIQPAANRRRWFRFSMRTLFVLVTIIGVVAGWVAYQLSWIRQRRAFTYTHRTFAGYAPRPNAPWPLRLFGEEGFLFVFAQKSTAHTEMERARRLFPESKVEEE